MHRCRVRTACWHTSRQAPGTADQLTFNTNALLQGEDSVLAYFPSGTRDSLMGHFTIAPSKKGFFVS